MSDNIPTPYLIRYLLSGLSTSPLTLGVLLRGITEAEMDTRPDPDRFTLREALAHLADWEGVWLERMTRIAQEDTPFLPSYDEGQWALDHNYAHADFPAELAKFGRGREQSVAFLQDLPGPAWRRVGLRDEAGPLSIFDMVAMILGHDGYHLRQVLDYRGLAPAP